jgi:hypothetical protein
LQLFIGRDASKGASFFRMQYDSGMNRQLVGGFMIGAI